jgi:hypothetical protein
LRFSRDPRDSREDPATERLYEQGSELDIGRLTKDAFMKRRVARFLEEFVVIYGYGTGLFMAVGFNPQEDIFKGAEVFIGTILPDPLIRFGVGLFLLLLLVLSVRKAFVTGGPAGIFAIAMGLLAGLSTPITPLAGLGMLALALVTGYIAVWGWRIR